MVAKISILRDQEKNLESNLWKMQEQVNTLQNQGRQISEQMKQVHDKLVTIRDERMKAERLKKVEKADKEEEN